MKGYHGKENAYFSLEACLVMPIVFYTIIFLIYVGFYHYDKCLLQQDIYRMLIRGSQVKFSLNEEVARKIKEEDAKWYYEKYILCNWEDKTVEVLHDKIRIKQQAAVKASVPMLIKWTGMEMWSIDVDFESARIRPTDIIRNCRKLEKAAERGKKDDGVGVYSTDES